MSQRKLISIFAVLFIVVVPVLSTYAQVSQQTGGAVFSLPMFNWKDNKSRLNSVVAISYSSGNGLKTSDVASNVGQGWNLVANGVIARMQVGEPDDQRAYEGNGTDQDISKYPAGYLYATSSPSNGCPTALTKYPIYKSMNQIYAQHNLTDVDKQLDYFSFQFGGKTGLFVLDAVNGVGRSLGDTKMKILFQTDLTMINQGIRTTITSFTIQDVDGLTYKFTQHGLTKVLHADFCDAYATKPITQPKLSGGNVYHQAPFDNSKLVNPYIIGSWYLSEIDDPLTNRKIQFNYVTRSVNNTAGADISYNQSGDYTIISHKNSVNTVPEISSIVYPDGHMVTFNYGAARVDLNGENVLSAVDVSYTPSGGTSRTLSEYQLNTSYFLRNRYGMPTTAQQKSSARLCLRSVKKIGVDLKEDSPPYIFDYYLGSNNADDFVPPPFFYAKDIWGFYNGTSSVPYDNDLVHNTISLNASVSQLNNDQLKGLCFLNNSLPGQVYFNPKTGYAKNGLLKQIIYPTGGTLAYTYTQDSGVLNTSTGAIVPVGGVHVSQTSSTDGGSSNGCGNPITTQYNYVVNGPGSAPSLWGLEMPVNSMVLQSHYNSEQKKYHWTWSCAPFGCCYWNYQYPGILSQLEAVDLMGLQKFMNTIGPALGIITVVSDVLDVLNLIFVSTGVLAWVAVIVDIVGGLVTLGITCLSGDNSKDNSYTIFYNADLNGSNPLPAQFKQVEITESPGTAGKTVVQFTSSDDYALWVPAGANADFSAKQRYAYWAYGLPKLTTSYDVQGKMVKQITNYYGFTNRACDSTGGGSIALSKPVAGGGVVPTGMTAVAGNVANPSASVSPLASSCPLIMQKALLLPSCKCLVKHTYSQRNTDWSDPAKYDLPSTYITSSNGDMAVDIYDLYTGRLQLNSTYITEYQQGDPTKYVQKATYFYYNSLKNYEVNQIANSLSNGKTEYKYMSYSSDYPATNNAAIKAMLQVNMVSQPLRVYTTVYNPSTGIESALSEDVTEFGILSNGDIKSSRLLEQRFIQPVATTSVTPYSPDNAANGSIYKIPKVFTYDGNGNQIGIQDEGGRVMTDIYDYDDKYVVASAIGADPVLDKAAYTSFETSGFGGWQLTGTAAYSNTGITGTRSFAMTNNQLSSGHLNTAKPYILSFWATSGMSVTGGGIVKSAPTINGFTYYEYAVGQGTDVVIVSGSGNIDELRLYPAMARMRSLTYDPLVGKTSECDENNRITYYEYDNLSRLRFIKDENHSILKMYEYNNVSAAKQNGCPGTYSNNLVTEFFTRSNCAAGYQGGDASYSVPAARYTSTISQQDADTKAELDLLTNGPGNANISGSCSLIYHNVAQSQTDSSESCGAGMKVGFVTYTVPAGTYSSIISQADADQQAVNDVAANAIAYANSTDHQSCSLDTSPDWQSQDGAATYCHNVNGALPAHQIIMATDMNPHSPTYNQSQYMDLGPTNACPAGNYYNVAQTGSFSNATCASGSGLPVPYTIPEGAYSSTVSMAAANQLAANALATNGQANANAVGTCCAPSFTFSGGVTNIILNDISRSGTTIPFTWVFTVPTGATSDWTMGFITSNCCWPTGTRTIPFQQGTTVYNLIINTNGMVELRVISGPAPSGVTVGFSGSYDLTQNSFYSAAESGFFTRNNCPAGQVGSSVTYSVQPYTYKSFISQADADQQAINQVNAGGQTYANANGTCSIVCSFTWGTGLSGYQSTLSSSGTAVTFTIVFPSPNSSYTGGTLGTITGGCKPSSTRFLTVADGATSGRSWSMTITSAGVISISLASGSAATNSGPPIVLNGSFSL